MNLKEKLLSINSFVDNQYLDKYVKLIESNLDTVYQPCKTNSHHIVPAHYYRHNNIPVDNTSENRVNLLFADHMLAHLYLSGCTEGKDKYWNLYSVFLMSGQKYCSEDELIILQQRDDYQRLYEEAISAAPNHRKGTKATEETRERMKKAQAGRESYSIGRVWVFNDTYEKMIEPQQLEEFLKNGYAMGRKYRHTEEKKKQIGEAGRGKRSPEFCEKMRQIALAQPPRTDEQNHNLSIALKEYYKDRDGTFKGKHHTDESNKKNRESHVGKWTINNGEVTRYVYPEEAEQLFLEGWVRGKAPNDVKTRGKIWVHNDVTQTCIDKTQLNEYLDNGWKRGRRPRK